MRAQERTACVAWRATKFCTKFGRFLDSHPLSSFPFFSLSIEDAIAHIFASFLPCFIIRVHSRKQIQYAWLQKRNIQQWQAGTRQSQTDPVSNTQTMVLNTKKSFASIRGRKSSTSSKQQDCLCSEYGVAFLSHKLFPLALIHLVGKRLGARNICIISSLNRHGVPSSVRLCILRQFTLDKNTLKQDQPGTLRTPWLPGT